ncbi:DUF6799 domain-containing protein [Pedobacter changchengzhani]|uniref:DUF6799 domain-containing protein n=1 Tax=Pedobacter changchengzhani TaxID=2529274 RepID=UPI001A9F5B61|nr:DUF6799 domain-containing protein [Pedobacter changchengzhani]
MKSKKVFAKVFTSLFTMLILLSFSNSFAQTKNKNHVMKDCCMMKDGKMMVMKDGKTMPMDKSMKMKNGTTCMTNGECTMKDGSKMTMKDGDCMEMSGKMCNERMKTMHKKKASKKGEAIVYTCSMHPEVVGVKGGKCPKCGMDLVKK